MDYEKYHEIISTRFNPKISKAFDKLYDALYESAGIIDYGNKQLDNFLFSKAIELNNIIHDQKQFMALDNAVIDGIYPYEFKVLSIKFENHIKDHWINTLYVLINPNLCDKSDAFVFDKSNYNESQFIHFDDKPIEPLKIENDHVVHASIILSFDKNISENIIYKIFRHELKHIYHRYKRKVTNDEIYKNNIEFKEYIDCDVPLFNVKTEEELINNIRFKAGMEDILMFLYSNTYLLNTSEIQAKLEDFNIDLSRFDKFSLHAIRSYIPGVYNFLPRVSNVAALYLQLYKTLILIRDNYDQSKVDEEIDRIGKLENIYGRKFDNMFDLLNFFANDIIYHLFIRHAVNLYDKACNKNE